MNYKKLKKIVKKILINNGLSNFHALISSEALINAELVGAPSHGLSRLKMYCDRIKKKVINPKPKIKIKQISKSIAHIDASPRFNLCIVALPSRNRRHPSPCKVDPLADFSLLGACISACSDNGQKSWQALDRLGVPGVLGSYDATGGGI